MQRSGGKERDTKPIVAPQPTTLCVVCYQCLLWCCRAGQLCRHRAESETLLATAKAAAAFCDRLDSDIVGHSSLCVCAPRELQLIFAIWPGFLFVCVLHSFVNSSANDSSLSHLVNVFAPVLCRPAAGAFMSIRHIKALPHLQTVLTTMVQYFDMVFKVHCRRHCANPPAHHQTSLASRAALCLVCYLCPAAPPRQVVHTRAG